jgi:hypothetical protein
MPTHQKATKENATSIQVKTKLFLLVIWHIWITLCHHLVCFCKSNSFSYLSQTHLFGQIERYPKSEIDQVLKTPTFPIIKILPHKRPNFAIRVFWTKYKFYYFQNSQVVG